MPLLECVACGHVQTQGVGPGTYCEECGSPRLRRASEGVAEHLWR